MKSGLILAGEPMGLLIAQSEGSLDSVSGYDLAVAGAEFNVAVGVARLGYRVTYMTKLDKAPFGQRIIHVLDDNKIGNEFVAWSDEKKTGFMLKSRGNAIGAIQVTSRGDNEGLPYPDQLKAFMEK